MGTPLQSVGDKVNQRKGNQAKDALPRTHPDRHRRHRLDPDKGLEGRLALGQPGMPVQLSHLRRLAGPCALQMPSFEISLLNIHSHYSSSSGSILFHSSLIFLLFLFTDRAEDPKHFQSKTIKTQVQVKTIKPRSKSKQSKSI